MLSNIPHELREWVQWIVWRYEETDGPKPTKVPYNPRTGTLASVTNPNTWATFEECAVRVANGQYSGLGFVLTERDPFSFIDLDDCEGNSELFARHQRIFNEFQSYNEISPSGNGLHIIVRGNVPAGRKRAKIEVYSAHRYMTVTGNVLRPAPIVERQELLSTLWNEMGAGAAVSYYGGDFEEKSTDDEVMTMATNAANGEKFAALWRGDWQALGYGSQSEADFALVDILAFYTKHKMQLARLFRASALGQREKAQRSDYVNWMIGKSFDRMLPPIDLDSLFNDLETKMAERREAERLAAEEAAKPKGAYVGVSVKPYEMPKDPYTPPPGLMGEIAQYVYSSSVRPIKEIALVSAIGLMAGLCGRAWNISNTGLNLYLLLVAPTGSGKEGIATGITRIVNAVRSTATADNLAVASVTHFIGPAEIASGQALIKYMQAKEKTSFVSVIGEFGLKMKTLSHEHASPADLMLKRVILDLYHKSGHGQILYPMIYSDKDKSTSEIVAPAFSLVGETTPETFFNSVDEGLVADGLLPRFLTIEYDGKRPPRNDDHATTPPSFGLVQRVAQLAVTAHSANAEGKVRSVGMSPGAKALLDRFDVYADHQINSTTRDVVRHLWNRAHIKALKLSALVAVGVNFWEPIVTEDVAQWACNIVAHDIEGLMKRFEAGTIGAANETKQEGELKRIFRDYLMSQSTDDVVTKYMQGVPLSLHAAHIIPYQYIIRRSQGLTAFKNKDGRGIKASDVVRSVLTSMVEQGLIEKLPMTSDRLNGYRGVAYAILNFDAMQ